MTPLKERGQSLAEFALVIPIFVLLMVALFDLGRLVVAYTSLTNGAREGARLAVVNQDLSRIEDRVLLQTWLTTPVVTVEFRETGPDADAADNDTCSPVKTGCIVRIESQATLSLMTPIIGGLVGPLTMNAESQMPIEFVCPSSIPGFTTAADCPKQP